MLKHSVKSNQNGMTHHNVPIHNKHKIVLSKGFPQMKRYGVSSSYRVLSPQKLFKCWDQVRRCLKEQHHFTPKEREVVLLLLRYWVCYGMVYPKAEMIAEQAMCSISTVWRVIARLQDINLVEVVNRFVIRPKAQISNLYRLNGLILMLARFLAEHGIPFTEKWLTPFLTMPARVFWTWIYQSAEARAGPELPAFQGI